MIEIGEIYTPKESMRDSNKQFQYLRVDKFMDEFPKDDLHPKYYCSLSEDLKKWTEWIQPVKKYFIETNYELYVNTTKETNRLLRVIE